MIFEKIILEANGNKMIEFKRTIVNLFGLNYRFGCASHGVAMRFFAMTLLACCLWQPSAEAFDVIEIPIDVDALDISESIDLRPDYGPLFQVSTAPGADGIVRRIEVGEDDGEYNDWAVFALTNTTDEQVERLLVVPHYRLVNSGIVNPDLGSERIVTLAASQGVAPVKENNLDADVFLLTIDPGAIITYVAELTTPNLPQIYLWKPEPYADNVNSYILYQGIVLGISGLLAIFLSIIVIVKGTVLFPAAAALAWSILAFLCVDFGFWNKLIGLTPGGEQLNRASTEILLAGCFLIFNYAYLNRNRWRIRASYVALVVTVLVLLLLAFATVYPTVAAGIARMSLAVIGFLGMIAIILLSIRGHERAIMLAPTWMLFVAWIVTAMLAVTGQLDSEIIQPALDGGLVLIVLLIGFSVMQHAFAGGALVHGAISEVEKRALAMVGSGDVIWDWDVDRNKIYTDPIAEELFRLRPGTLQGSINDWLEIIHPMDRDHFQASLDSILEQRQGRISQVFRFHGDDDQYRSFLLKARPVLGSDAEVARCIGTLHDVTDQKLIEERLAHDAIFDSLTGLPNRSLFLDRLHCALIRTMSEGLSRPAVLIFNLDQFDRLNQIHGVSVSESILLTVSRRLSRLLKPQDCLARITGERFAIMVMIGNSPNQVVEFAEILRKSLRAPITFGVAKTVITSCVGIAVMDDLQINAEELVCNAEIAMQSAKNIGDDSIMVYSSKMRSSIGLPLLTESDLSKAIERKEIKVLYQPIVRLENKVIAGFEAFPRWQHPVRGLLPPVEFIPLAERSNLVNDLGRHILETISEQLGKWQQNINTGDPIFTNINITGRQLTAQSFVDDMKSVLSKYSIIPKTLRLELTENVVMQNPVLSMRLFELLKANGCGLSMDKFGSGYSTLDCIQSFPFDSIKIDKDFVRNNHNRESQLVVLRNLVGLAHDLGMEVVADGVDTQKDVNELEQIRCEFAQGYLFGPPMRFADADQLVAKRFINS